jgi:hypothetical protein
MTDGGPSMGLNMLWLNAKGDVRSEEVGANAILSTHTGFFMTEAYPVDVNPTSATWNVAWVEQKSDVNGTYHVLYLNQLLCQ